MDYVHAVQKVADCLSGVEKDALQKEFENKEMDAEVAVQASRSLGGRAAELALIIRQGGASLKEFLSKDPSYGPFLKRLSANL